MFSFGFEIEGFYEDGQKCVQVPPDNYPRDAFAGLVELRNYGPGEIVPQLLEISHQMSLYNDVNFTCHKHTFSRKDQVRLIANRGNKTPFNLGNIYGLSPRLVGNATLASFQVSFSVMRVVKNNNQDYHLGILFDYVPIIRRLDLEFKEEIVQSNRQPGFYAIKGNRVEYRSLPNFAFRGFNHIHEFSERLNKCFKGG